MTVVMDGVDIGYLGFNHKHEELVIYISGAPWGSKSTHPRKFGYHVTVHRPPVRLCE